MTQVHNIIKNEKKNIKCELEDTKMHEAVKTLNDWHPKENRLSKQKKDLSQMKKKQPEIIAKYLENIFFFTNAAPIQNLLPTLDVNTIHFIRNKKNSMDSEK